jgi:hypothetical protein
MEGLAGYWLLKSDTNILNFPFSAAADGLGAAADGWTEAVPAAGSLEEHAVKPVTAKLATLNVITYGLHFFLTCR